MSQGLDANLLYEALGSPLGVVVRCSDTERARQKLYALRKECNDPDLDILSFVQSPTSPLELWIVRKNEA